jgi:hypothetical protein
MSGCPTVVYNNITQPMIDCLRGKLASIGIIIPPGNEGEISGSGFTGKYKFDPPSSTLTITIIEKPDWATCEWLNEAFTTWLKECGAPY